MKAAGFCEMSVNFWHSLWHHSSHDGIL